MCPFVGNLILKENTLGCGPPLWANSGGILYGIKSSRFVILTVIVNRYLIKTKVYDKKITTWILVNGNLWGSSG
jgi:hypothetical protein